MALSDAEINILIKARDEATHVFDKIKKSAGSLSGALGKASTVAGGFVLAQGIINAPGFLIAAAQAAADDAASVVKLQQAVTNSGATWEEYKGQLDAVILAGQKKGFTDDQTRDALALLVAQTGSATEATRRYSMAQDLARGANIDVFTASKLLGKVTEENVNVLNRYGIVVAKGASETELFGAIQQKFGGQADAFAKSTAGRMAHLRDQMQELKEQLGAALLPVMSLLVGVMADKVAPTIERVVGTIKDFSDLIRASLVGNVAEAADLFNRLPGPLQQVALWLGRNKQAIQDFVNDGVRVARDVLDGWRIILIALAPKLLDLAAFLAEHKTLVLALAVALGVLVLAFGGPVVAIAAIIVAGGLLAAHWDGIQQKAHELRDSFRENFGAIYLVVRFFIDLLSLYVETQIIFIRNVITIVMALLRGDWGKAWEGMKALVTDAFGGMVEAVKIHLRVIFGIMAFVGAAIREAIGDLGSLLFGVGKAIVEGLLRGIEAGWDAVTDWFRDAGGKLLDVAKGAFQVWSPSRLMIPIGEAIVDGIAVGIESRAPSLFARLDLIAGEMLAKARAIAAAIPAAAANNAAAAAWVASDSIASGKQFASVVGGRTRDEWKYIFGAAGIPASEYESKLKEMFGYAQGTPWVPRDGWAFLHRGERVVPAAENKNQGQTIVNNYYIQAAELHGDAAAGFAAAGAVFA